MNVPENTLLGNRERLAFEITDCWASTGQQAFCSFVAWADGMLIGYRDQAVMLSSVLRGLKWSAQYCGRRMMGTPPVPFEELWDEMQTVGDLDDLHPWHHRFPVLTGAAPSFDGFECYLAEYPDREILIWRSNEEKVIRGARLKLGTYGSLVEEFAAWYAKQNPEGDSECRP